MPQAALVVAVELSGSRARALSEEMGFDSGMARGMGDVDRWDEHPHC